VTDANAMDAAELTDKAQTAQTKRTAVLWPHAVYQKFDRNRTPDCFTKVSFERLKSQWEAENKIASE